MLVVSSRYIRYQTAGGFSEIHKEPVANQLVVTIRHTRVTNLLRVLMKKGKVYEAVLWVEELDWLESCFGWLAVAVAETSGDQWSVAETSGV